MFETVRPPSATRNRWLRFETLPVSIAVHLLAIGTAIVVAHSEVEFPNHSPRMNATYLLASPPPPPPPPPPPATAKVVPQTIVPRVVTAPTVIPDAIPVVASSEPIVDPGVQ